MKDDDRVDIGDGEGCSVAETDADAQTVAEDDTDVVAVPLPDVEGLDDMVGGAAVSEARGVKVGESVLEIEFDCETSGVAVAFVDHVAVIGVGGMDGAGDRDGERENVPFELYERRGDSEFVVSTDAEGVKVGDRVAGRDADALEDAVIPDLELLAVGERVREGDAVVVLEMDGDVETLGDRETNADALKVAVTLGERVLDAERHDDAVPVDAADIDDDSDSDVESDGLPVGLTDRRGVFETVGDAHEETEGACDLDVFAEGDVLVVGRGDRVLATDLLGEGVSDAAPEGVDEGEVDTVSDETPLELTETRADREYDGDEHADADCDCEDDECAEDDSE